MIITLGGKCGAGKGTVSTLLSEELGYEIISIGNIKRALASKMGMTILEFDTIGRENPEKAKEFDLKYEEYQKTFSVTDNIILDSRMSFWCQPDGFNVFLDVTDEEGGKRIFEQGRSDDESSSLEAVIDANAQRHLGFKETYMKLYGVDIYDLSQYDLVIDTTDKTPEQVFEQIISGFRTFTGALS